MVYDVYGFREASLGDQPDLLADALGVVWELHESDYRGMYLLARSPGDGGGTLILQSNDLHDSAGEYLQLPDFPQYRYLLFVNRVERPDEVGARLVPLAQWHLLEPSVTE